MPTFLCQLENNSTFPVRVVIASQFNVLPDDGEPEINPVDVNAQDSVFTQLHDGQKALVVFQRDTGELLDTFVISVTRRSKFKLLRIVSEVSNDGVVHKVKTRAVSVSGEDLPDDAGGPDTGTPL